MHHLFDRVIDLSEETVRGLVGDRFEDMHPASPFRFLADRTPSDGNGSAPEAASLDDALAAGLTEAIEVIRRPTVGLFLLERSPEGRDLTCVSDGSSVVAAFYTPWRSFRVSLPVSVDEFARRLVDDIGLPAEDEPAPDLPGAPGLVVSGQRIPPDRAPAPGEEARNAMFAGPRGRRWLIVPSFEPSDDVKLVRIAAPDLELFVADLLHRTTRWGGFGDARPGWVETVETLDG